MAENCLEMVENDHLHLVRVSQVRKNIFAFCVITFEPIEVQTRSATQNERLNLKVVVKKMARNGRKTAIRAGGSWRLLHNGDRRISLL